VRSQLVRVALGGECSMELRIIPWYHADPTVLLQYRGSHLLDGSHTAPAQCRVKLVECHALAGEVFVQNASIVDEQRGCCFEQRSHTPERNVISATM
jgi:hypothetical protein